MFRNKIIRWSTLVMVLAILAYFFTEILTDQPQTEVLNPEEYAAQIAQERADKDNLFRTSSDSPIADKERFEGLDYFAPDLSYRVQAKVVPYSGEDKSLEINYTDGTSDVYKRIGYAVFEMGGKENRLLLLEHDGVVSVLYRDATTGVDSYGGGRYLDFPASELKGKNAITLDFNKGYNPYCAYTPSFACPLPPAENTLSIPIRAGEKYHVEK